MTITVLVLISVTLTCYIVALIRKARWTPVDAEVIDFHIVSTCPTSRRSLTPLFGQIYAITYRYLWNGQEQIESVCSCFAFTVKRPFAYITLWCYNLRHEKYKFEQKNRRNR